MKNTKFLKITILALFSFLFLRTSVFAATPVYDYSATLVPDGNHPGVYVAEINSNNNENKTIGIPSITKQSLENAPTTESPAIIMGAAVPFERKVNPTMFERTDGGSGEIGIYAPYNKFRYTITPERASDGSWHNKLSGYDGTYIIIRVDVSNLINEVPMADRMSSYLHIKQEGNAVLMVALGPGGVDEAPTFSDGMGNMVGSYSLANDGLVMKDADGSMTEKPYFDVILMSSGMLVQGADSKDPDPNKPTADFKLKFYIDKIKDYNPTLVYDPNYQPPSPTSPTMETLMMGKYFFDDNLFMGGHYPVGTVKPTAIISSYKVKGSDLEIEVVHGDSGAGSYIDYITNPNEYWSFSKALIHEPYNNEAIKLICEVPVLETINIDGTDFTGIGGRKIILDVNSFDIQIANHKEEDTAGLTVKNATMTLMDGFNTTGAELAVGNNSKMIIETGGLFIVEESCQLEVEYDASSITSPSEATEVLNNGLICIEDGGKIKNLGIITIEGTEGKPLDPLNPVIRDVKNATLSIKEGGEIENYGCLLSYGELYNMGTIKNYGNYNDLITSQDPDKGNFTYHKGIQISWKDDVTQDNITKGYLQVGKDKIGNINPSALLENNGDIVLAPGVLDCYGVLNNKSSGNIYVCPVEEAIIPITPLNAFPLKREKIIIFGEPIKSNFYISEGATFFNEGNIKAAKVAIVENGRTGDLTIIEASDRLLKDLILYVHGTGTNAGMIKLDAVYIYGQITNTGNIETKVIISKIDSLEGVLNDNAATKLTEVYNAAKEISGSTNIWRYAPCGGIDVSPGNQKRNGGTTPNWIVVATSSIAGNNIKYFIDVFESVNTTPIQSIKVNANTNTYITGPVLPEINGNIIYNFRILDINEISAEETVSVTVSSEHIVDPTQIGNLIYNGKEQKLITTGGTSKGEVLEYRLGTTGGWSTFIPTAKNAGTYTVQYKLATESVARGETDVVIAKRSAVISGIDISSKIGDPLKPIDYTISGLVAGETLSGINISSTAVNTTAGTYPINITVTELNPNYEITINSGNYVVTDGNLMLTAKDKYGTYSDEPTYAGFDIDLTVNPTTATAYYSLDTALDATNYETNGWTIDTLPEHFASAGIHTMYYYVPDGINGIGGNKKVIIEKATQSVPNKIIARAATAKGKGDCWIEGFEPRAMEYRKVDGDGTYTTVYYEKEYVTPGEYFVRRKSDENHFPSPDFLVIVEDGTTFNVQFYKNQDELTPMMVVEGLSVGDLVTRPEDPTWDGHYFLDWYSGGRPFNFNKPVIETCDIVAFWDDSPPHVHNTVLVPATPSTCTEIGNTEYYTCTLCDRWFEDAFALVEIRERSSVIIEPLGHDWNSGIITKEATYDEDGILIRTCNRNHNHKKTEIIPRKQKKNSGGSGGGGGGGGSIALPFSKAMINNGWNKDEFGWRYIENGEPIKNAWRTITYNGMTSWYFFGENGMMATGWLNWNNNIYYLYSIIDGYEGQMLVGWRQIEGKWYYFEPRFDMNQGHMYRSEKTPDGYSVGIDGAWDGKPASVNNMIRR